MEAPTPAKFAALAAEPQAETAPDLPYGGFGVVLPMGPANAVKPMPVQADPTGPRLAPVQHYLPELRTEPIPPADGPVGIAFPVTIEIGPVDALHVSHICAASRAQEIVSPADDAVTLSARSEAALSRANRLYRVLPHRWILESASPRIAGGVRDSVAQVSANTTPGEGRDTWINQLTAMLELRRPGVSLDSGFETANEPGTQTPVVAVLGLSGSAELIDTPVETMWRIEGIICPALPDLTSPAPANAPLIALQQMAAAAGSQTHAHAVDRPWPLLPSMPGGCGTTIAAPQVQPVPGTCEVGASPLAIDGQPASGADEPRLRIDPVLAPPSCIRADLDDLPCDTEEEVEEPIDNAEVDRLLASLDFESGTDLLPVQTHIRIAPEPAEDAEEPALSVIGVMQYKPVKAAVIKHEMAIAVASAGGSEGGGVAVLEEPVTTAESNSEAISNRTVPLGLCGKEPIVSRKPVSIMETSFQKFGSLPPFRAVTAKLRAFSGQGDGFADSFAELGSIGRLLGDMNSAWKSFPHFFRGIALVAVPLLIPTLFYARISPSTTSNASTWESMKQVIRNRATILIQEDFSSGLGNWAAPGDSLTSWSIDEMSFVQPGRLALLQKSVPLVDYRFEFLARLEQKSVSFVMRAADARNYYVCQLQVVKGGPQPLINIVRYAVVEGVEGPKTELPLPMQLDLTKMFTVLGTVRGENFTVSINGQMVDNWSDARFGHGGIGFFTEKGARYRLKWVRVVDKDDFLGWLCSRISPGTADIRSSGEHQ
jgi:hypothetical protein